MWWTLPICLSVRDMDHAVRVAHDRHVFGLFARADWLRLFRGVGFQPQVRQDPWGRELFLAVKPEH
jgi:hypothetical protein